MRRIGVVALVAAAALGVSGVHAASAAPPQRSSSARIDEGALDLAVVVLRTAPVYVYDSRESSPAVPVQAAWRWPAAHRPPQLERPPVRLRPVSYVNVVAGSGGRRWLQYWTFHLDNTQDRGIVRTGRHQGDWELVQVRLDAAERPDLAVYAQHSWAEACPWARVERVAGVTPVVYVANGSHAALFRRGRSDRPWPDPNDEADGAGLRASPEPVLMRRGEAWVTWPGRWGAARAGWVPGEQSSPRGPLFQGPGRDPDELLRRVRPCGAGPPGYPQPVMIGAALLGALGLAWNWRRRKRRAPGAT